MPEFKDNPQKINNGLISKESKHFFVKYNFVPELVNLKNKSDEQKKEIIAQQEKMRKIVRGWAGSLG